MLEMEKMAEVLNLLLSSRILLSFHHYLPHIISSVASIAKRNLMEGQCKKITEIEKIRND
jgi:hypothetical protein